MRRRGRCVNASTHWWNASVGSLATVRERLGAVLALTGADELMLTAHVHDHAARLRPFELASHAMRAGKREAARV